MQVLVKIGAGQVQAECCASPTTVRHQAPTTKTDVIQPATAASNLLQQQQSDDTTRSASATLLWPALLLLLKLLKLYYDRDAFGATCKPSCKPRSDTLLGICGYCKHTCRVIFPVRYKMRSVVVVLPASMCAMIPMFRMRRTSSSADKSAASGPCPWPSLKSVESRLTLNALATALLTLYPRGDSSNEALRLCKNLLRPRESSSAIVWLLLSAQQQGQRDGHLANART